MTRTPQTRRTFFRASGQQGISFISLIFWMALLGAAFLIGMKTVPIFTEFGTVKSALSRAKSAGSEVEIRRAFDNAMAAGYGGSFNSQELVFQSVNGKLAVGFAYERKVALIGPASLLFELSDNQFTQ
jgi:Domain of unknown function (DUF4845)